MDSSINIIGVLLGHKKITFSSMDDSELVSFYQGLIKLCKPMLKYFVGLNSLEDIFPQKRHISDGRNFRVVPDDVWKKVKFPRGVNWKMKGIIVTYWRDTGKNRNYHWVVLLRSGKLLLWSEEATEWSGYKHEVDDHLHSEERVTSIAMRVISIDELVTLSNEGRFERYALPSVLFKCVEETTEHKRSMFDSISELHSSLEAIKSRLEWGWNWDYDLELDY